jgi:hypothetical protein
MKVSEILRAIADIADAVEQPEEVVAVSIIPDESAIEQKQTNDIDILSKLAGLSKANTTPEEHYFPFSSASPAGDDLHHSKNPADMRSDSISLYPNYSASPKE